MSLEQLKAFLAKVKDDSNLQKKLKAAKSPDDVVGIAKEHGHEFTADKIEELSQEELEGVSGGGTGMGAEFGCRQLQRYSIKIFATLFAAKYIEIVWPATSKSLQLHELKTPEFA
ncbi:nif11-like leader peptide domain protein [Synechococcus sp. BIOS-E4-1]|uniref:Nif11-like leader peptide family natural product precursor n=1 Tax=Synechococcus sp. BIOS-E4-1 TaxID=1400864 RepID=UPI00164491FC|nr:nif11-like leader peptide domain protein [Synechococcus sp. BIOS-E4-1]